MTILLLCFGQSGCGKETAAPAANTSLAAPSDMAAPPPAPEPIAEPEPVAEHSDIAIDEPLPPFEDDSGIVLVSHSALRAADAELAISGEVFLYEAPDGSRLLRLESLRSPKELRINLGMDSTVGGVSLVGALKGPSGNMSYLLESGPNLASVRAFVLVEHGSGRVLASAPLTKP